MKKIRILKTKVIRKKFNLILMIILAIMVLKWAINQARVDKNKFLWVMAIRKKLKFRLMILQVIMDLWWNFNQIKK